MLKNVLCMLFLRIAVVEDIVEDIGNLQCTLYKLFT